MDAELEEEFPEPLDELQIVREPRARPRGQFQHAARIHNRRDRQAFEKLNRRARRR